MKVIIFKAGSVRIAVDLKDVREVLKRETGLPGGEAIEAIRGKFVRICDAARILDNSTSEEHISKTIVLELNNRVIGLATPSVSRIYDVNPETIQPIGDLSKSHVPPFCTGVVTIQDFSSPVYLLGMAALIEHSGEEGEVDATAGLSSGTAIGKSRVVCFKLGGCEYAFTIDETVEIIRGRAAQFVPHSREVVEGVINLRGVVLPVVDLRRLAGVENDASPRDRTKIVVVTIQGQQIGFRVDLMTEVTPFQESQLRSVPDSFAALGKYWIKSILKVTESRVVFVINSDWFVHHAA